MRTYLFTIGLILLTLTTFQISPSKAETATSGNLLPNAGDGHNSTSQHSSNTNLDSMGSANGFTLNGISPKESVNGILKRIDSLNKKNSGTFWHANGEVLPW